MQYLVTEELIDPGPQLPPDQLVAIMRQWVLPSMDALINLKSEGKIIAGGLPVGERALVLIFEAESMKRWTLYCKGCLYGDWQSGK